MNHDLEMRKRGENLTPYTPTFYGVDREKRLEEYLRRTRAEVPQEE